MPEFHGTTICAVKRDGKTAIAGDGQVTMSESIVFKNNAVKVRRIYNGKVILGFAGIGRGRLFADGKVRGDAQ